MNQKKIETLLRNVKRGNISINKAVEELKKLPFEDLGFAKIDHHRAFRKSFPEVIYCPGKNNEQIIKIINTMNEKDHNILATRLEKVVYEKIIDKIPCGEYNEIAKTFFIKNENIPKNPGKIIIACAGTSDLPIAEEAYVTATVMGNNVLRYYDVGVAGIHRLLDKVDELMKANVIIVVAGMEGALASVVGGIVNCPVIAVPTSVGYGASFGGLSALLTMLNSCASGVAVVNIDNGFGAGYIASLINSKIKK